MAVGTVSVTLRFSREDVTLASRGLYTGIVVDTSVAGGAPGAPALPWRKVYVAVPSGAMPGGLAFGGTEYGFLADNILVEPIQPNLPTLLGTVVRYVPPDPAIYESDAAWPDRPVRTVAVRRLGHFTLFELQVCPVRYHPRSRRLELLTYLRLVVAYEAPDRPPEPIRVYDELAYMRKIARRVEGMVLNPGDVLRFGPGSAPEPLPAPAGMTQIDYVIITNDNLAGSFGALAKWRSMFGLQARVVRLWDILNNQVPDTNGAIFNYAAGYWDGGTRDTAEAVRNFIKWAALHWNTDFVLLGGDTDVIPARLALATLDGKFYPGGDFDTPDLNSKNCQIGFQPLASSEQPDSRAVNVLDDNPATAWRCTAGDANPWIRLRLQPRAPINHLILTWGANHATGYEVAVSGDGINWANVYTTAAAPGGTQEIAFHCVSASWVRLRITSGTNFALERMGAFGPRANFGIVLPQAGGTCTRILLGFGVKANPTNDVSVNRLLVFDGPLAGTVIPYDEHSGDAVLGWHFIEDLLTPNAAVSPAPTAFLEIRGPAAYHGSTLVMACDFNMIPADLYYSDVAAAEYPSSAEHDWDAHRNGVYGERFGGNLDQVNGLADVYLGRAPVDSEGDAAHFVDKVIRYEQYVDQVGHPLPPDFAVSVLLGSENWFEDKAGVLDPSAAGKEDIRHSYLAAAPGRFLFTRRYQNALDVLPADQGPDLAIADTGRIVNAIQAPNHAISLTSHGNSGYICYLATPDVQSLVNPPSIWYGNACLTNAFDVVPGDALSEEAILNHRGGAVAYVGNSRWGHTSDNPFELAFWQEMLRSGLLGKMFAECKQVCDNAWPQYALNLLGDPAMRVWSDRPARLEVGIDPHELCVGRSNAMTVSVYAAGNPLPGAVVVVSQNGTRLGRAATDAGGRASLQVVPPSVGDVDVAVYGQNLVPVIRQVPVVECPLDIVCELPVTCAETVVKRCLPQILCGPQLACHRALVCPHGLLCAHGLVCAAALGCMGQVEPERCPGLRPDELDVLRHIREIWGVHDIEEFVRVTDGPQFEEKMARLPIEIRKPIRMLLERLRGRSDVHG